MQYSPKLKKAAEEIKAIIEKYDIAAVVALHTPGFGEHIFDIEPSYSVAKIQPDGNVRIQAKAADFGGSKEERDKAIQGTANMLHLLSGIVGRLFINLDDLSCALDEAANAEHLPGSSSSHLEQNN